MKIEYDELKNQRNINERMLPFAEVIKLDWSTARVIEDTRHNYPEKRFVATGAIEGRIHIICFTPLTGGIRVISFRKANQREVKRYEQQTTNR